VTRLRGIAMLIEDFEELLRIARDKRASDVHLGAGSPPMARIDGDIIPILDTGDIYLPENIDHIVSHIVDPESMKTLQTMGELDMPYSIPGVARLRVNIYRQRGSYAIAARLLNPTIPSPETLGIPDSVVSMCDKKRGMVLFTGPTGSGKSTSLASLIDVVNERYHHHIITLEDPIEYLHRNKSCIVHQREIGPDTKSYANALRAALREDPDVILIGEMRDLETISIAATAAKTGHLVFSTLHTVSAVDTVNRIIDVFPPHQQEQIRTQLADILICVVAEQLLPRAEGKGRVAAYEVMLSNSAIRNYIREGKTYQITTVIQTNKAAGMKTMDDDLIDLYRKNIITKETAIQYARDRVAQERKFASGKAYE
jgi:twitching motility protein PilT